MTGRMSRKPSFSGLDQMAGEAKLSRRMPILDTCFDRHYLRRHHLTARADASKIVLRLTSER